MTVAPQSAGNWWARIIALALIICLMPIFALISLVVFLSCGRPIFFSQSRVGRGGKPFRIVKFRTMTVGSVGPKVTSANDRRITRFGSYLRYSKLDELPQLFNILAGEMAFFGPRPEDPHFAALWSEADSNSILSLRPGLVDPAILKLKDEEAILAAHADPELAYTNFVMPQKMEVYREFALSAGSARYFASLIAALALFMKGRIFGRKATR